MAKPKHLVVQANSAVDLFDIIRSYRLKNYVLTSVWYERKWFWWYTYFARLELRPPITLQITVGPIGSRTFPKPPRLDIAIGPILNGRCKMSLVLTDIQKVSLAVKPVSAAGNPAPIDGKPEWACSNPTVLTLDVADDGMSCVAVTTGTLGVAQVSVKADADLGDGVTEISGTLDIEVKASQAVSLGMEAGVPENK